VRCSARVLGPGQDLTRGLSLYCVGFCAALDGQHRSEDLVLFDWCSRTGPISLRRREAQAGPQHARPATELFGELA
jgi:hypothetical protein